jgi:hypothetical protein
LIAFVSANQQVNFDKNRKLSIGVKNRIKKLNDLLEKEEIEFNNTELEKS